MNVFYKNSKRAIDEHRRNVHKEKPQGGRKNNLHLALLSRLRAEKLLLYTPTFVCQDKLALSLTGADTGVNNADKKYPPRRCQLGSGTNLKALEETEKKVVNSCYWSNVSLPKHMCVNGQIVLPTAEHNPDWADNPYENLSEISETSVQPNPDHHALVVKDTSSKVSMLEKPKPLAVENADQAKD